MRSVACLISLHVSCGCNHGCLIIVVATPIVVLLRRTLLRPHYALGQFVQGFDLLLMLLPKYLVCLHLPNFVATMEVCARCVGGSRSVTIDGYLQQETR